MVYRVNDWPLPSDIVRFDDGHPNEDPWVLGIPASEEIEISSYSPEWPILFDEARVQIVRALQGNALNIEHIGSTAVPGLAAKPIIDIDLIVRDPTREDDYVPRLTAVGYVLTVRERTWYQHRMLRHHRPNINLHVFGPRCPEHVRHIVFRDWLRDHEDDRAIYEIAKDRARKETRDIQEYNRKKRDAILKIYRNAFQGRGWGALGMSVYD